MRGRFASLPEISRRRARRGVAAVAVFMLLFVSGAAKERLDQLAQGAGGRKKELPNHHASDPRNEHGTFAHRRILREVTQLVARLAALLAALQPPRQAAKAPSTSGTDFLQSPL
jgi:hypothetical protein